MNGKQLLKILFVALMVTVLFGAALNPGQAVAAPLYASVTVTADSLAKSGIPGSVVDLYPHPAKHGHGEYHPHP